jgi:ABC-type dipeptide/oligopeptide/nickel transport system permease subunit
MSLQAPPHLHPRTIDDSSTMTIVATVILILPATIIAMAMVATIRVGLMGYSLVVMVVEVIVDGKAVVSEVEGWVGVRGGGCIIG